MPTSEPWVGTWRPHRPRGSIAALHSSPGPKYALPSLTGASSYDPTKYKAPSFSFGSRHDESMTNCSPGPGYLIPSNITRTGKDGTPIFSLYSRTKDPAVFQTPGPGTYSPEHSGKMIFRSSPAISLSGRKKDSSLSQVPGPASYTLPPVLGPKSVLMPAAPSFSLYSRDKSGSFHEDMKKTPGPAAYKSVDPCIYSKKPPQYSIIGRNFAPDETTKKPGPGAYYPEKAMTTKAKAPSFSFGLRHSQYIAPLIIKVPE